MRQYYLYIILTMPAVLGLLWCGCSDSLSEGSPESASWHPVGESELCFDLRVEAAATSSPTRAADDPASGSVVSDYRGRRIDENRILSLTALFVPVEVQADGSELEHWEYAVSQRAGVAATQVSTDAASGNRVFNASLWSTVPTGDVNVYVGLNLCDELVEQCKAEAGQWRALWSIGEEDYEEVLSRFIDPALGTVAMFSAAARRITVEPRPADATPEELEARLGSESNPISLALEAERMVAKVLLVCDMARDNTDDDYVRVEAAVPERYQSEYSGWIRLASVRFKLATTNRTSYFCPHLAEGSDTNPLTRRVVDPNYSVASQLVLDDYTWTLAPAYDADFTTFPMREENSFRPGYEPNYRTEAEQSVDRTDRSNCLHALRYSASRLPDLTDRADRYVDGLYCLENTTDNGWSSITGYDSYLNRRVNWFVGPRMINTNMIIETQYIPAVVHGEACLVKGKLIASVSPGLTVDDNARDAAVVKTPYCFGDAATLTADGLALLREPEGYAQERAEERARAFIIRESQYPDLKQPTYYALLLNEDYYFFTYKGMRRYIELLAEAGVNDVFDEESFLPFLVFEDGMGYYQSYMNDITDRDASQQILGLTRNNYYILRCSFFNVPSTVNNSYQIIAYACRWEDWVWSGSYESGNLYPDYDASLP